MTYGIAFIVISLLCIGFVVAFTIKQLSAKS